MKIIFISLFISTITFAQQKMVCVSWMGFKTDIFETLVTEFETANILYDKGDWAYEADYFEGRFNYLKIIYKPLNMTSTSRALNYPLYALSNEMDLDGKKATVDCNIR